MYIVQSTGADNFAAKSCMLKTKLSALWSYKIKY